jgi:hypothetical protein
MARLTITLSDSRYRALKETAARRGKTIGATIEECLDRAGIKTVAAPPIWWRRRGSGRACAGQLLSPWPSGRPAPRGDGGGDAPGGCHRHQRRGQRSHRGGVQAAHDRDPRCHGERALYVVALARSPGRVPRGLLRPTIRECHGLKRGRGRRLRRPGEPKGRREEVCDGITTTRAAAGHGQGPGRTAGGRPLCRASPAASSASPTLDDHLGAVIGKTASRRRT